MGWCASSATTGLFFSCFGFLIIIFFFFVLNEGTNFFVDYFFLFCRLFFFFFFFFWLLIIFPPKVMLVRRSRYLFFLHWRMFFFMGCQVYSPPPSFPIKKDPLPPLLIFSSLLLSLFLPLSPLPLPSLSLQGGCPSSFSWIC